MSKTAPRVIVVALMAVPAATFAPRVGAGQEREPTLAEIQEALRQLSARVTKGFRQVVSQLSDVTALQQRSVFTGQRPAEAAPTPAPTRRSPGTLPGAAAARSTSRSGSGILSSTRSGNGQPPVKTRGLGRP